MLILVLVILIVIAVIFGGWSYERFDYGAFSPLMLLLLICLVLYLAGALR